MASKEKIEHVARGFRQAIELTPKNLLPIGFSEFPLGSCGDTCLILGRHFIELGFGAFDYVLGVRGDPTDGAECSHAWLMHRDIVVDITGDQFPDFAMKVFVGRKSDFHSSFEIEDRFKADYLDYDHHTSKTLGHAYQSILMHLQNA